jgi:hypothetical protein
MPVFSYIAYPKKGAKDTLLKDLSSISFCDVMPAENGDILLLVTDTPDEHQEKILQKQLKNIKSLQSLGMTFGHTDD